MSPPSLLGHLISRVVRSSTGSLVIRQKAEGAGISTLLQILCVNGDGTHQCTPVYSTLRHTNGWDPSGVVFGNGRSFKRTDPSRASLHLRMPVLPLGESSAVTARGRVVSITARYQTMDVGSVPSSDPAESEYEHQMSEEPQSDPIEVYDSDSEEELETVQEINIMVQDDAIPDAPDHDAFMDINSTPSTPSRGDADTDDPFGWRGRDGLEHEPSSNDTIDLQGLFGALQGNHPPRTVQTPPLRLEPVPAVPVDPPVLARLLTDQDTPMGASTDIYEPPPVDRDWSPNLPPDNQEFLHEEEHMDDERLRDHESLPGDGDQTSYIEYNLFVSHQFINGRVGVHVERNMILPVLDPFNPRISFSDLSAQMTHREIGRLDHVLDTAVGEEWMGPCVSCEEKDVIDAGASRRLPCFVLWNVSSLSDTGTLPVTSVDVQVEEAVQPNDTESRRPTNVTRLPTTPVAPTEPVQWAEWDLAYSGMIDLLAELDRRPWNMAFKWFAAVQAAIAISGSVGVLRIGRGFNRSLKPVQEWMLVRLRSKGIALMAIRIGTFQNWVSSLRTDLEAIFWDLTERKTRGELSSEETVLHNTIKVWYTFPWPDTIEGSYEPTTEDMLVLSSVLSYEGAGLLLQGQRRLLC
ncbi:hypothetical protein EDD18DRAFT_1103619 [Armillaria luteobubalina]|uniref:Uncharacterized protein n=1 Tax=Armillaria luteobubalina TaxID=153913 RepID=A0AA39QAD6_9AGAR|nr:hypothetical protein EDD18DRAFT_1103619 [Armillaria luteobubalina]